MKFINMNMISFKILLTFIAKDILVHNKDVNMLYDI